MTDTIYFAHGNGFPSLCYKQLLDVLGSSFKCHYIDRIGHDPDYPVTENWDHLVDELLNNIRKMNCPVIGVGHSLGGVLHFLAAVKEPSLYKALVIIDSPLLGRFKSGMIRLLKSLGLIDKVTPASRTKVRKQHWRNRDELYAYLKSRPLFQTFSEDCLNDYIEYGFKQSSLGYNLYFDRHIEYLIFRTLPHHLPLHEGKLRIPATLIYGDKSTVVDKASVLYMKEKYQVRSVCMPGTHMLPFETPKATGIEVINAIEMMLC